MKGDRLPAFLRPLVYRTAGALKTAEHWTTARLAMGILWGLRKLPADKALDFADRTARRIGPKVSRHKVALDNLRHAYPEKTEAEIEEIASDMWGNMARLAAEYVFLGQIFDHTPGQTPGRVEIVGEEIFERIRDEKRPHIILTGHTGNFELLPIAAAAYDLPVTALFRAPNNPYMAEYILKTRRDTMGDLLASRAGAAFTLARVLDRGGNVGVLVDQKFHKGQKTTFFGRECRTNPLVPKLARQFECDVYPARSIRLPGNRYRLELQDKIELPRNAAGAVDIHASCQMMNDIVEGWVREHPGQWMWFHKRWAT
ncbi:MAG: lipid A biosynthesis lauroyl acyltransferase [Aliihoeflea sp.]